MNQQIEVINKIKSKEEEVRLLIQSAQEKAAKAISDAKVKAKDIVLSAQRMAEEEVGRLEKDSLQKTKQELEGLTRDVQAGLKQLNSLSERNMEKAKNFIIEEFLKLWQLQR